MNLLNNNLDSRTQEQLVALADREAYQGTNAGKPLNNTEAALNPPQHRSELLVMQAPPAAHPSRPARKKA